MPSQTGSIDLKAISVASSDATTKASNAAKTATNYITADSTGIKIASSDPSQATTYQHQTATNTEFIVNDSSVAEFGGSGSRIGKSNQSHLELDYHSIKLIDRQGNSYFHISDLRDENGNLEVTEQFVANGSSRTFTVKYIISSVISAIDSSHQNSPYEIVNGNTAINFYKYTPDNEADVTITYITRDGEAKAYTIGERHPNYPIGGYSYGEGYQIIASGKYSHAEGYVTTASGRQSHAEGYYARATGMISHAEGAQTIANGGNSHAEGDQTTADNYCSHAEGSYTTAGGSYSHAEGYYTTANGSDSHAEGYHTTASSQASHAEGDYTTANRSSAHAEGSQTTASGLSSHAEGCYTKAIGDYSHAQNYSTVAASSNQTALGKFNIRDDNDTYAVIIGNGTADNSRSNALTIDWNGNTWLTGGTTLNGDLDIYGSSSQKANVPGDAPSENEYHGSIQSFDSTGDRDFYSMTAHTPADVLYRSFVLKRDINNTSISNGFYLRINDDGTEEVTFTNGADSAWRTGLGLGSLATKNSLEASDIPSLAASKINSGTFDAARIPSLAASKINSGTFDAARIPSSMAASKIESTSPTSVTLNSATKAYSSGMTPKYRKWGNVVNVYGAVSPKSEVDAGGSLTIGSLPSGYRPSVDSVWLCQGSGNAVWALTIDSDGTMRASRYRSGASVNAAIPTNAWLIFNVTYIVS